MNDHTIYNAFVDEVFKHNSETAVSVLEHLSEAEASQILYELPPPTAVHAVKQFQISYAAELLKNSDNAYLTEILTHLDTYRAASIMMHLPPDKRDQLSELIPENLKEQIRDLLTYPENSVGRIMSTWLRLFLPQQSWLFLKMSSLK